MSAPTATIINIFRFLDWIPGPIPWRTRARAYRKHEDELYERLVREAVSGKSSGMNTYVPGTSDELRKALTLSLCRWAAEFAKDNKPEGDQRHSMNVFAGVSKIHFYAR